MIKEGSVVVLMAPFGAGKSLTTRELFKKLAASYRNENDMTVPIALNLREHWGQEFFDEILERHARSIGFTPKEDLVIAWRAGLASLLMDGFDEVASQTIVRKDDVNFMREARRSALAGVRDFMTKLPSGVGVFICGRDHYFDNIRELSHSLGLAGKDFKIVKLDEFTEDGVRELLRKNGFDMPLPDWLPRKPLILSYLMQNNLLEEILNIDSSRGYGYAWDCFITKIANRESELERAAMDSQTLRSVMERLAFFVRSLPSGDGPITGNDLATAYNVETGQSAGEGVLAQLQRLPGLTQRNQEAGSRSFVDGDFLAALQGGVVAQIVRGQYEKLDAAPLSGISEEAVNVAAYLLTRDAATSNTALAAAERLAKDTRSDVSLQLAADCLSVAIAMSKDENSDLDCHGICIKSASIKTLDLEENDLKNVSFAHCEIGQITVGKETVGSGVSFSNCLIGKVTGIANRDGLPQDVFSASCDVEDFDDMATNNAVMQLDLEPQVKALMTVLRKLYRQSGAGRKVSALSRGVTKPEVAKYIPGVLNEMEKHGFVRVYNNVVHPVRKRASRVDKILNAPSLSRDEVVQAVKEH